MRKLHFANFEFDPRIGRLTKYGHTIKLQPKSAGILACLLEHHGEVVTRDQLQKTLWPEGTHVDFDLGIKVAVNKLRDALGDQCDEPTYIQTVYGEGYRFIAPVNGGEAEVPIASAPGPATEPVPHAAPLQTRRPIPRSILLAGGLATTFAAAVVLSRTERPSTLRFQNRDWAVIAAFENRTGETLFDGSMEFALERELSRSRYLNVVPPDRIDDALRLMRRKTDAPLTSDVAREVALRDGGVTAVLAGRVEKFGATYVLTVRVLKPSNGETVTAVERKGRQDEIPDAVRSVSDELRERLGDPAAKSQLVQPTRLERATTRSLSALAAFSAGMRSVNQQKWRPASQLLEEAVKEDPQFALAHIYAAHCYSNLHEDERAAPHYRAAFELADGVADRERLFIQGSYAERFLNDDRRAVAVYEALVDRYPDDYWATNNLIWACRRLGMMKEEMEARERRLSLRPRHPARVQDSNLLWWYYRRFQVDSSKAARYRDLLRAVSEEAASDLAMQSYFDSILDLEVAEDRWWRGDVRAAAQDLDRAMARSSAQSDDSHKFRLMSANLVLGRLSLARGFCGKVSDPQNRAECFLFVAYAAGDLAAGKTQLSQLRVIGPSESGRHADICLAMWFGEIETAEWWRRAGSDQEDGLILLARGRYPAAVQRLEKQLATTTPEAAGANYARMWPRLALATALERLGRIESAIQQLQAETNPGNASILQGWPWPQCRMKLAELLRKAGRSQDAANVEDEIRRFLGAADKNHPILARLSKLGGRR